MLKIIELFAGIGSQTQALKNLGIAHEVVAISEIDKYAIKSYEAIHGPANNLGDITKIEELPAADLWTYSFPCQDISVAGKLAGIKDGTRSGLLRHVERLLLVAEKNGTLPKYLLLENVKNLVGKKFKADFDNWLIFLEGLGYTNYWQVLNAKHYGIPQNRERVFGVSIRGEHTPYVFPEKQELKLKLRDMIDDIVDEKYYLSEKALSGILTSNYRQHKNRIENNEVCNTLMARDYKDPQCVQVGELTEEKWDKMHDISKRVYGTDGVAPTVHTCGGGNTEPKILQEGSPVRAGELSGGVWDKRYKMDRTVYSAEGVSPTLHCCGGGGTEPKIIDDFYANREPRVYEETAPALRSAKHGLKIVAGQLQPVDRNYNKKGAERQEHFECRSDEVSNAVLTGDRKNCVKIVAMRGRNPDNPSDRTPGNPTEQRLEENTKGLCNALTTVQKDNLVLEETPPIGTKYIQKADAEVARTVRVGGHGDLKKHSWDVIDVTETEITKVIGSKQANAYVGNGEISPALTEAMGTGGGQTPMLEIKENTKKGFAEAHPGDSVNVKYPTSKTRRGRVGKETSQTLLCDESATVVADNIRIRKLTPRECLRLMGWKDEQIDKIIACGVSNTQIYKQAGNGIVVQVLEAIFGLLFHFLI